MAHQAICYELHQVRLSNLLELIHDYFSLCHRFRVVVLSSYKQILAQSTNVLSDIDEDNFDRASVFSHTSY